MRMILNQLETALDTHPGPHVIQWLEYYNPDHNNPFGDSARDGAVAGLLLGSDLAYTDCGSTALAPIGLDDAINCIAREKGATPVDSYAPFQANCSAGDCFSDGLHPNDKGYGLIFTALRDTPATPVPSTPPPDLSWPFGAQPPAGLQISDLRLSRPAFVAGSGARRGAVLSLTLNQAAAVTITFQRLSAGRRIGEHCLPATHMRRRRPACTRILAVGSLHRGTVRAGRFSLRLTGRLGRRALAAGHYRAVVTAANSLGLASPRSVSFRVLGTG